MKEPVEFRALWVEETTPGTFTRRVIRRSSADLTGGSVLVRVHYSSLNYKDALSATGNRGVTRSFPHTPGIDAAGIVAESDDPRFKPGDSVLVAAVDLGVNIPGGYGQLIRAESDWLVPLPAGLTLRQSMIYGTAGFTAAMCVDRLQSAGLLPAQGEVLVTGATGGVGSIAVGILSREGYSVTAATGKPEQADFLRRLGAQNVVGREEVIDLSGRPLLHARWSGVVDTVGGSMLASAIRAAQPGGIITACGNAASPELSLTVFPFILRGITLFGIDATRVNHANRVRLWSRLGNEWKLDNIDELAREVGLEELEGEIQRILRGQQTGRVIVNLDD